MASQSGFMLLVLERGPWYYVQNVYALMCLLVVSYLFYNKYRSSIDLDRTRFTVLLLASIIPYLGITMIIGSFMGVSLDYTAMIMPISLVLMMYSILRFDFLEIKALARDTIFEISDDGMILLDNENYVLDFNQSARHIFELPSMTIKDRGLTAILDHRESLIEPLTDPRARQITLGEGDQERFYEIHSSQIKGPRGHQIGVLKSIRDITEKKKLQDHLERMATIDELSGLLNRGQFIRVAQLELNRTRRYEGNMAILMMDLDYFKGVNDTWGHAAGDAVIAQFGKLLEASFRSSDVCGRMGGEEFAVLLTNTTAKVSLRAAERFRKKVETTSFLYRNQEIRLTVSIGISEITNDADTLDTILSKADEGAYESKAAGRNRVTLRHVNDTSKIYGCT
jgi:diguanylate cyclase (GGDEF)-like protein/PAS domain S-box-containing protein